MRKLKTQFVSIIDINHSRNTVKGSLILLTKLIIFTRQQQKWNMHITNVKKGKQKLLFAGDMLYILWLQNSSRTHITHETHTLRINLFQFTKVEKSYQVGF